MMTGFKTALIAAIIAIFGALQGLDWLTLVSDPKIAGWIAVAIGGVMAILRYLTSTPIFKKD